GLDNVSGVGFSFGVDRIYDVLEELGLFPEEQMENSQVMIGYMDLEGMKYGLKVLGALRAQGIKGEIYPDVAKLKKQLNYADKKSIPFVLMVGPDEMAQQKVTLKIMKSGEQQMASFEEILHFLQSEKRNN